MVIHNKFQKKHKKFSNKVLENLKVNHYLTNLTLHYGFFHSKEVNIISNSIRSLRRMNSMQLRIMNESTPMEKFNDLVRSFRFLPELKSLDFTIAYANSTEGMEFKLPQALKSLKNLTSLSLNFGWGGFLNIPRICKGVKALTGLTNLNLNYSCAGLTNADAIALANCLSHLTELTQLRLDLSRNSISKEGFTSIIASLRSLTKLKQLDLTLNKNLIQIDNMAVFRDSMQVLTDLEVLNLNFSNFRIFQTALQDFGEGLAFLRGLKVLKMSLMDCHLNEKQIQSLGKGISELTSLIEFDFDLTKNQLHDRETMDLIEHFRPLREIRTFSLGLSHNLVGDWVLYTLAKVLGNFANLENLSLNVFACKLSDKGIKNLAVLSEKLSFLKELVLIFNKNTNIKDAGVRVLMDGLTQGKKLKEIRIDFAECKLSNDLEDYYVEKLKNELPECNTTILFGY